MRRAAKVDANQADIVRALRQRHHWVMSLAGVGGGCPDLLVWSRIERRYLLVEVKDGSKPPSAQKLTPDQIQFHATCPEVHVVNSVAAALKLVGER